MIRARPLSALLPALLPLALAACGDLPQPFAGNPGAAALRLAVPPPPRLDVPQPTRAMLADPQRAIWTRALVAALLNREVPAVAQPRRSGDWSLAVSAALSGAEVVPHFTILGPNGRDRASRDGAPVPAGDWMSADPAMVSANAALAAGTVNAMLDGLQAQAAQTDPDSLLNRPTRIWFGGVTGAPGDGDRELAGQMRLLLPDAHDTLQADASQADYLVSGHVSVSPPSGAVQHVEIVWTVTRTVLGSGGRPAHEAGRATQLHDVAAHSLDATWGDSAEAAAEEAAGGIHEVIANNEGRTRPAAATPGARSPDSPLVTAPLAEPPGDSLPRPGA